MKNKRVAYITTNESWSGSEELWTRSAADFIKKKYQVIFASKYSHDNIRSLKGKHYIFRNRFTTNIFRQIVEKVFKFPLKPKDSIVEMLTKECPSLVILSQGNNIDQDNIMKCCQDLKIPYVTITNLVTEYHFLFVTPENLAKLQSDYSNAVMNYFVSAKNLQLHNLMLASNFQNSELIYCPVIVDETDLSPYPSTKNIYNIGLVGRIDCFHKGYDLLIELACMEKWKSRPIKFNVYGNGPHKDVLSQNIACHNISNIVLKGYEKSSEVWKDNNILFMPSRMEGVALSLLEAMYCKRAAIVTDVGDATKLITNGFNGFVSASATVLSLDRTLEEAWEKRDDWENIGKNAHLSLKDRYSKDGVTLFNQKICGILAQIFDR